MGNDWVNKYLWRKWSRTYDCFVHFAEVQTKEFNRKGLHELKDVPTIKSRRDALDYIENNVVVKGLWDIVDKPEHGDAVIFGSTTYQFHIGTYLATNAGGGVLHCTNAQGVVFTKLITFKQIGAEILYYGRYKGI